VASGNGRGEQARKPPGNGVGGPEKDARPGTRPYEDRRVFAGNGALGKGALEGTASIGPGLFSPVPERRRAYRKGVIR
jgi:hypothetical protein